MELMFLEYDLKVLDAELEAIENEKPANIPPKPTKGKVTPAPAPSKPAEKPAATPAPAPAPSSSPSAAGAQNPSGQTPAERQGGKTVVRCRRRAAGDRPETCGPDRARYRRA